MLLAHNLAILFDCGLTKSAISRAREKAVKVSHNDDCGCFSFADGSEIFFSGGGYMCLPPISNMETLAALDHFAATCAESTLSPSLPVQG